MAEMPKRAAKPLREQREEAAEVRKRDAIFAQKMEQMRDFAFDTTTSQVFDDMVERSVPLYLEQQRMLAELTLRYLQPDSVVYDLGCATGNTLLRLAKACQGKPVRFVGVDNAPAMLEKAQAKLQAAGVSQRCELRTMDITSPSLDLSDASVVIMGWTLQFVRPLKRDEVISRIYNFLRPSGCLILTEKLVVPDPGLNRLYIDLYYDYKRRQGYTELEIGQKREALENVLIPYQIAENTSLLQRNGFPVVDVFFRWYNWCGIIAVK